MKNIAIALTVFLMTLSSKAVLTYSNTVTGLWDSRPELKVYGDGSGFTNLNAASIVGLSTNGFQFINTNFVNATLGSNYFGTTITIVADAIITGAGSAGYGQLALESAGNKTNYSSLGDTVAAGYTGTITNQIIIAIPPGGTWYFRNTSTVGSATVGGAQILYLNPLVAGIGGGGGGSIPNGLLTNNGTAGLIATNGSAVGGVGFTNGVVSASSVSSSGDVGVSGNLYTAGNTYINTFNKVGDINNGNFFQFLDFQRINTLSGFIFDEPDALGFIGGINAGRPQSVNAWNFESAPKVYANTLYNGTGLSGQGGGGGFSPSAPTSGYAVPIMQAGATNVSLTAATSQAILFAQPMPSTNYVPYMVGATNYSNITTNGMTGIFPPSTFTGPLRWSVTAFTQ